MNSVPQVRQCALEKFDSFVDRCMIGTNQFSLIPAGPPSPFALCFGVFSLHLTRRKNVIEERREELIGAILENLNKSRITCPDVSRDKSYRQLLTLSISALSILGAVQSDELANLVLEQTAQDTAAMLRSFGALDGVPQSGNQAMFQAILLLHAGRHLGVSIQGEIDNWVDLHLASMNSFGFWGNGKGPTHLHFQNGYHQYEILEYLGVKSPRARESITAVMELADRRGHYAPYPGGGACFDYDAVFLLTPSGELAPNDGASQLLLRTFATLVQEQKDDGGFCENLIVRPRCGALIGYLQGFFEAHNQAVLTERIRYAIALQRRRYDRLKTHWSIDSRRWSDSDLFSSWFRMLALARIECAFSPERSSLWGFVDCPGIGWHSSLRGSISV